jgi:transcriptional regulator with XRE-family HTH domain
MVRAYLTEEIGMGGKEERFPILKIKELREARGWSQTVLAEKAGLSSQTISTYEIGTRKGRVPTLRKIARALQVHVSELLSEEAARHMDPMDLIAILIETSKAHFTEKQRKKLDVYLDLVKDEIDSIAKPKE